MPRRVNKVAYPRLHKLVEEGHIFWDESEGWVGKSLADPRNTEVLLGTEEFDVECYLLQRPNPEDW